MTTVWPTFNDSMISPSKRLPPPPLVAVLALAENAIGSGAYKPHAIIESHKGLSVLIGNTDAEGRLALADALSYGQSKYQPHTIVDVATLTGACVVALGEYASGLFYNDDGLRDELVAAADATFERVWPMPIFPEHEDELKTAQADVSSTGAGRYGGACTAAAFLRKFVDSKDGAVRWAHLDIAGPGNYTKVRRGLGLGVGWGCFEQ